jgi:glycosyltransferase involved in cell wall biosynthesis
MGASIVVVMGRFPPPVDGQAIATEQAADLLEDRFAVHRISTAYPETNVRTEARLSLDKVRHYVRVAKELRRALAEAPGAPVLWHSISPQPLGHWRDVLTTVPAFGPEQPVYGVVHWGDFDRVFRSPLTRHTARWMLRRLRGLVFLNEGLAERCAPWVPPEQRFVVPNTIHEALVCTEAEVAAKREAHPETPLRLLYLSNMIASKGYLDVLEAVAQLHTRGVAVRADFIGGWTAEADRERFGARVARAGLGEVVTHHGAVYERARVKRFYLDADVFLLPTYYPTEAQPLTILEALSAGTPVVTTEHASIPYMVRGGQEALFVPPQDPAAIARAVEQLAHRETWQAFSRRARRRFVEAFSPDAVRARWEALLAQS